MSDDTSRYEDTAAHGADEHATPHLPPPSFAPINVAFSLALIFVGFLKEVRATVGPIMWVIGVLWLIAACAVWARSARREYLSLPEDANH